MNYLLRDANVDLWQRVKVKCAKVRKPIRFVILTLLVKWVKGEVEV